MQFHLNGFKAGDPAICEPVVGSASGPSEGLPPEADVLIVGCGPAGLTLAAQLSRFPSIRTVIVDQKPGPLELGQADGVACRTMEMFNAFGFVGKLMKEAYWVNETTFWKPDPDRPGNIARSGRVQDVEDGLSEFPHVILNQARVHDFYLEVMRNSPSRLTPAYSRRLTGLSTGSGKENEPVTATFERLDLGHQGETETVGARYVVGCDGARSIVRKSLGHALHGDSANQAWGVMDVLAVTDFPDVRLKSLIQSAGDGSIVLIPREGGYLFRLYVELDKLDADERVSSRKLTIDQLIAKARRILNPFMLDVKEVAWWSVYEIGQRLCDRFDDVPEEEEGRRNPRVFIAGDACHTHSPKAGQGMNVSMQDAFNLGWKLAAVLEGRSPPELLATYSTERRAIAKELIDFDREWAALLSAPVTKPGEKGGKGVDPVEVQQYFVRHGRYTAGTATLYKPSVITGEPAHQKLARGFSIGTRFHSAPVIRLADAKPVQLGHIAEADGRWRLIALAGREDPVVSGTPIHDLCDFLDNSPDSPMRNYTPKSADIDAVIDMRAVFQRDHRELVLDAMHPFLLPKKGRYGLVDYEKMYCPDLKAGNDIFELRGIDRKSGCLVVIRPDQYVANILPLNAFDELSVFFAGFMLPVT